MNEGENYRAFIAEEQGAGCRGVWIYIANMPARRMTVAGGAIIETLVKY